MGELVHTSRTMANEALKTYLTGFLHDLGRKASGGRYIYDDLLKASALSKTTLFKWLKGGPATLEKVEQLAHGLLKLAQEASGASTELRGLSYEVILEAISEAMAQSKDALPPFKLFRYAPISEPTARARTEWSFLGDVLRSFLNASNLGDQGGGGEVTFGEAEVSDLDWDTDEAVLAGCFATPDRAPQWAFIRTPISIPLNAVLLERDLATVLRHRPAHRRPRSVDDYVRGLNAALWRHYGTTPPDLPRIRGELLPITVEEEAGRKHLLHVHRFELEELERDEPENASSDAFLARLLQSSEALHKAASSGQAAIELDLKLPIALLDELTALKVLKEFDGTDAAKATAARLLADPAAELAELGQVYRPRFSVTLAIRRDQPAAMSSSANSFDATKRCFEEFIFSHAGMVTHQYVRLYCELMEKYGRAMGEFAALHFLRWLSIEVTPADIGMDGPAEAGVLLPASSENPDMWPWQDVLRSAKATIIHDSKLREELRQAMAARTQVLAGRSESRGMVGSGHER